MLSNIIDRLGEGNPQLFRELKGKLKPLNLVIASMISLTFQLFIYLLYETKLPSSFSSENRYCTGNITYGDSHICLKDALGQWIINRQLWSLDIFICLSIIGICATLTIGTYLLISDISKEDSRGTLGFIRLSPQSAQSIMTGKMLGVPVIIYLICLLAIPWHLGTGLAAQIPISLIFGFYLVMLVGCIFFYYAALFYSLVSSGLTGFKAWLGSGLVLFYLFMMNAMHLDSNQATSQIPFNWFVMFYPGNVLSYLVKSSSISEQVYYFKMHFNWYNLKFIEFSWFGIGLVLLNYCFWIYWLGEGIKRRFHNPHATPVSKSQSYWISGILVLTLVGFTQPPEAGTYPTSMLESFGLLFGSILVMFLAWIAILSPHRQTLQDWARYRHYTSEQRRNLFQDLIWGEKSPSTLAIAINLGITVLILVPAILLWPPNQDKIAVLMGLFLQSSLILIYAAIAQLMLLMKTNQRAIWTAGTIASLTMLPIICFAFFQIEPSKSAWIWLFSIVPIAATKDAAQATIILSFLGQWLAITVANLQLTRKLQEAGASQHKISMAGN